MDAFIKLSYLSKVFAARTEPKHDVAEADLK
jgi:hypothetical protein